MSEPLTVRVRIFLLAIPAVILLLDLPTMLTERAAYRPFWLELAAYVGLVAVTALAVPVVARRAPWGRWRWPMLTAALVFSTASTAATVPDRLFGTAHWSWDIFGWWALLFLLDRPVAEMLAVLVLHVAVSLIQVAAAGRDDRPTLVGMAISALALGGLPVSARLIAAAADRAAAIAARTTAAKEQARTAGRIAAQIHQDRQIRYAELSVSAGALLTRLAEGLIDPADPGVQRAFFVEAARLRRLFAEADQSDDRLTHEVMACADTALRRGLAVVVAVRGPCPSLPFPIRRAVTDAVLDALAVARSRARITLISVPGCTTVTVVADVGPGTPDDGPVPPARDDRITVTRERLGGSLWVEARWGTPSALGAA